MKSNLIREKKERRDKKKLLTVATTFCPQISRAAHAQCMEQKIKQLQVLLHAYIFFWKVVYKIYSFIAVSADNFVHIFISANGKTQSN